MPSRAVDKLLEHSELGDWLSASKRSQRRNANPDQVMASQYMARMIRPTSSIERRAMVSVTWTL